MSLLPPRDVSDIVTDLLGFRPEPTRYADIENAVRERLRRRSLSDLGAYQTLLEDTTARSVEARALADRLTINETYFLREYGHLDVLVNEVASAHFASDRQSPLRILSLGCSSGEEPYGIAMALHAKGIRKEQVRIVAVDASANAIARAERARFSAWSLRNVDAATRSRYFASTREGFVLSEEIRSWVRFGVSNLMERDAALFEPESFDVVFCRNVLIYFTPDAVRRVIDDIHATLRPGGVLFLGHAETGHAGRRFVTCEGGGAFYFTKRRHTEPETSRVAAEVADLASRRGGSRPDSALAIATAQTDRPRAMQAEEPTRSFGKALASPTLASNAVGAWAELCLGAIRAERFDEAIAILDAAPAGRSREIFRASILANRGSVADARRACGQVLDASASDSEAHYLLGLCDELEHRTDTAREHYARSAVLDEDFAMPRLRLGMLARRRRQYDEARRWLGDALRLFPYQTERVLLVFGGGFHVDGLTRLCRTEFDACKKTS